AGSEFGSGDCGGSDGERLKIHGTAIATAGIGDSNCSAWNIDESDHAVVLSAKRFESIPIGPPWWFPKRSRTSLTWVGACPQLVRGQRTLRLGTWIPPLHGSRAHTRQRWRHPFHAGCWRRK